jgi:hypothetical protein
MQKDQAHKLIDRMPQNTTWDRRALMPLRELWRKHL